MVKTNPLKPEQLPLQHGQLPTLWISTERVVTPNPMLLKDIDRIRTLTNGVYTPIMVYLAVLLPKNGAKNT
jgi:hypothetical protein